MKLSRLFIEKALEQVTIYHEKPDLGAVNVAIDSRAIQPGEFFIALKGAQVDGHDFIGDVFARGACGALIAQDKLSAVLNLAPELLQDKVLVVVPDTYQAFLALALARRRELTCPVVGITGTVGKTSTKEMLRCVLAAAGIPAYVSFGNYNTVVGISYNLLRVPYNAQVVVLEMGINGIGEMAELAALAQPTIGVITNVGHGHMAGLGGSIQGVAQEKRQIFASSSEGALGVINGDQDILTRMHYPHAMAKFGNKTKNQVQARKLRVEFDADGTAHTNFIIKSFGDVAQARIIGNHAGMVTNALAVATVAYLLKIKLTDVIKGIANYTPYEHRFQRCKLKNGKGILLSDCYNANPESMKAALAAFAQLKPAGLKVAVLGEMYELGDRQDYWHRQVGRALAKVEDLGLLIAVGPRAQLYAKMLPLATPVCFVATWQEAQSALEAAPIQRDAVVLVKASKGLKLFCMVKEVVE